jgi:hypothetical protein
MSAYLTALRTLSRTDGTLTASLALTLAVVCLPAAVLIFLTLAGLSRLAGLLDSCRLTLAACLRRSADAIDPPPASAPTALAVALAAPETPASVEAPEPPPAAPEPASEALAQSKPVPMPAAAQVTVEAPSPSCPDGERRRLAAALAEHGSVRGAARALGVGESTLRGRLKRNGVEAPVKAKRPAKAAA